jgi:hypothetical protein
MIIRVYVISYAMSYKKKDKGKAQGNNHSMFFTQLQIQLFYLDNLYNIPINMNFRENQSLMDLIKLKISHQF